MQEVLSLSAAGTHEGVVGVAFSPDGRRLMVGNEAISAVTIFDIDLTGNAEWANVPAPSAFTGVDFFPDGQRFVAQAERKGECRRPSGIRIPAVSSAAQEPTARPATPTAGTHAYHVDVSPDGGLIATASDASVKIWDAATMRRSIGYCRQRDR